MQPTSKTLLNDLLKAVSRSFFLTLRMLPSAVRPQIGLAYLLARATDTIADTALLPVSDRLKSLDGLRQRIAGRRAEPVNFDALAAAQPDQDSSNAERTLLLRVEEAISLLNSFPERDAALIREVLSTITSGQELDLKRFGGASGSQVTALRTAAELDDYTYRVAGCVGEFWTHMCRRHLFPNVALDEAALLANGIRFGKGLQLVNILRDMPKDLREGRCYFPSERLEKVNLKPSDLLNPENEQRFRPAYDELLDLAESHLAAGWTYTNTLPRSSVRVRLACAWPILIGIRTLTRLRAGKVLDPGVRIKVSRRDVRQIMVSSVLRYPLASSWENLFREARTQ